MTSPRRTAWIWLACGSPAMELGIWSMHFIGMLTFDLPIPLAYDVPLTLLSLVPAIRGARAAPLRCHAARAESLKMINDSLGRAVDALSAIV